MVELPMTHPEIAQEFRAGRQTGRTTPSPSIRHTSRTTQPLRRCSRPDLQPRRRWMVAGPEVARLIEKFQDATELENQSQDTKHHDQSASVQTVFLKDVQSVVIRMMEDFRRTAKICWYSTQRISQHHPELWTPLSCTQSGSGAV